MRSMGRVRGLARSHAVRDAWATPHPPRLRRVPSLSRAAGEGDGGAGMFRASLSGASGRVRNNDLFPRGVPAMLAASNPPSDPVPAPVAPSMAGPMEQLNRVGKTVARCFKRSIRPPTAPVAPPMAGPMEQWNSGTGSGKPLHGVSNVPFARPKASVAPASRPSRVPRRPSFGTGPARRRWSPTPRREDGPLPHRPFRRAGRDRLLRGIVPGVWCGRLRIARA